MINAKVIHGGAVAAGLGYPTANLDVDEKDFFIQPGVYAAYAKLRAVQYEAVLVVQDQPRKVEVHLFDYSGDSLYGSALSIELLERISDILSFANRQDLLIKINTDISLVREVFRKKI